MPNLVLKLRLRKLGSKQWTTHYLDEDQYTLDELQTEVNRAIVHRSTITLAVTKTKKRFVRFAPSECDNIAVLFDYE